MMLPAWLELMAGGDDEDAEIAPYSRATREHADRGVSARTLQLADDHPDRSLVERVRAGDMAAFETIYRAQYESLCDFAAIYLRRSDVCADLVDDVFAKIWTMRATWSPDREIAAYLRGAVRNRVRNFLRDAVRAERGGERWALDVPRVTAGPDATLELRETVARIWRAVAQLPDMRRMAITLRWAHQLEIAEIAEHMGISQGAVRVHLSRALAQLRELV